MDRKLQSPISARGTRTQQLGLPIQAKVREAQLHIGVDPSPGLRRGMFLHVFKLDQV